MRNILDPICEGLKTVDGKIIMLKSLICINTLEIVGDNIRTHITGELL